MSVHDPYILPEGLPAPEDDGGADHLAGLEIPNLVLPSSQGPVDLAELAAERLVLYVYPRAGRPGQPMLPGWDDIPGARGCTPQSCGFRDHAGELAELGARVAGLSAQPLEDQVEFAERNRIPYPVISDEWLELERWLGLPTFDIEGMTLYKRLALVAEHGRVVKVFYPVFPPDRNAEEVVAWLTGGAAALKALDAFLPVFEFAERHAVSIDADASQVDRAVREVTFRDVPVMRLLLFACGTRLRSADDTVLGTMTSRATVLDDVPGEGIVLGLEGRFWRLRRRGGDDPPANAVIDFRAEPGRLTTETRVHVADPVSRRKFARYWRVIRPFSGLTRILVLRAAKRRAERTG